MIYLERDTFAAPRCRRRKMFLCPDPNKLDVIAPIVALTGLRFCNANVLLLCFETLVFLRINQRARRRNQVIGMQTVYE